jgi:hypothetical protein
MQIKTEIPKNKVFKPHVLNMYLILKKKLKIKKKNLNRIIKVRIHSLESLNMNA